MVWNESKLQNCMQQRNAEIYIYIFIHQKHW